MKHHYINNLQNALKAYQTHNPKTEEHHQLPPTTNRSYSTTKKKRRVYSSTNAIPKYNIDDLIQEVKAKEQQRSNNNQILRIKDQRHRLGIESVKSSLSKCQSARAIRLRQSLDAIKTLENKHHLQQKQKQSLSKWKDIRSAKKTKQKQQKKQFEIDCRERRRQSFAEIDLKKKEVKEELKLEHQMKKQWINALRKAKHPHRNKKKSLSLKIIHHKQTQRPIPIYQISNWQHFQLKSNHKPSSGSASQIPNDQNF